MGCIASALPKPPKVKPNPEHIKRIEAIANKYVDEDAELKIAIPLLHDEAKKENPDAKPQEIAKIMMQNKKKINEIEGAPADAMDKTIEEKIKELAAKANEDSLKELADPMLKDVKKMKELDKLPEEHKVTLVQKSVEGISGGAVAAGVGKMVNKAAGAEEEEKKKGEDGDEKSECDEKKEGDEKSEGEEEAKKGEEAKKD